MILVTFGSGERNPALRRYVQMHCNIKLYFGVDLKFVVAEQVREYLSVVNCFCNLYILYNTTILILYCICIF